MHLSLQLVRENQAGHQRHWLIETGPRTRAPLGAKTTNAKAGAFKTPAPPHQALKPSQTLQKSSATRRSAKSKIIIPPSQPVEADILSKEDDDDYPEIEYAPPPPVELPDLPIEFEYDQSMPQFNPENMFRGWQELYPSPKDENGFSLRLKKEQEDDRKFEEWAQEQLDKSLDVLKDPVDPDLLVEQMIAAGPKKKKVQESKVDTLKATSAVAALSRQGASARAMQPTASSLQRTKKSTSSGFASKAPPRAINPSPMRHAALAAVSKNTIGFPKAPKPASIVPKKQLESSPKEPSTGKINWKDMDGDEFVEVYGEPPADSELWFRLLQKRIARQRDAEEDQDEDLFSFDMDNLRMGLEDEDNFQLPLPE